MVKQKKKSQPKDLKGNCHEWAELGSYYCPVHKNQNWYRQKGVCHMTNKEKFDEHKKLLIEGREKGLIQIKPEVYEMERLKYSDDPLCRKACAIIEYAEELYINEILKRIV